MSRYDIFLNYKKARQIPFVTLVIHGKADEVVQFANGEELYGLLPNKVLPLWIPECGHNNLPQKDVFDRIKAFLEEIPQYPKVKIEEEPSTSLSLSSRSQVS
eukprot:c9298_g1_i3.p2 GENE.c9298_g1_i3~~c9298_g1_i3.p2  ORF type:complete len:102 (+),score=25.46 c9298_g1_i3:685-990(+)